MLPMLLMLLANVNEFPLPTQQKCHRPDFEIRIRVSFCKSFNRFSSGVVLSGGRCVVESYPMHELCEL